MRKGAGPGQRLPHCYLLLLSDFSEALWPPCPSRRPGLAGFCQAGMGVAVPALGAAILGGPSRRKVTAGEGASALWPGALRDLGFAEFCPTFSQGAVCRCWDVQCVTTSLSCDFCLCSSLPSLGSEEMMRAISLDRPHPGVMGLGSPVSPSQLGSLTRLLSLLLTEGEVRRRGSGTLPSGPGRLKKQK